MIPQRDNILKYATFRTSRSGGSGGQNVNKVSSKVELVLNIAEAGFLNEAEKALVTERLAHRLDQEGNLHVIAQEDRSQLLNKERSLAKAVAIIKNALHVHKVRKPTKIPKSVIRRRLANKQSQAEKKVNRKRPAIDY
ncbi:alternative ribosome rescue aminoacyl-tRNA hydrolase ArfB [Pedobacter immunditicola]|uniref:alternative ribosome rescue aminoacyl-tRNA hydrolase ArfB n=1 Tax=Pedobacter immunditicola TaxID=3133440 RepID=UPI0030B79B31